MPPAETASFCFLGISSAEPDYRLSVMLNKQLGISLTHGKTINLITAEETSEYSVFTTNPSFFTLISNKSHGKLLIRSLKNIDFFLVINESSNLARAELIAAEIRKIPLITAAFVFYSQEIKDRNIQLLVR